VLGPLGEPLHALPLSGESGRTNTDWGRMTTSSRSMGPLFGSDHRLPAKHLEARQ